MSGKDVIREWTDALNRHDAGGFAALYAPNAILRDPQYGEPLEGRDAIRKDIEDFLRGFPDLHAVTRSVIESGDAYAAEGTFAGTHQGPLPTPDGEIPPTGRRVEFAGAGFYRLDGQRRILEESRYYDLAGLLAQLNGGPVNG
jgi:steroid delta-isomerase-like uncharacterized protein